MLDKIRDLIATPIAVVSVVLLIIAIYIGSEKLSKKIYRGLK